MQRLAPQCVHQIVTTDTTMNWQAADEFEKGFYFCKVCGWVFKQEEEGNENGNIEKI